MASKYIQKFPIPNNFPEILHDLSKEILRNQPEDIIEFSALYFKCLQEGKLLDYHKRGQNIPCDFKVDIPKVSSIEERGYNNKKENEVHRNAVEKSSKLSERPTFKKIEENDDQLQLNNEVNINNDKENSVNELGSSDIRQIRKATNTLLDDLLGKEYKSIYLIY